MSPARSTGTAEVSVRFAAVHLVEEDEADMLTCANLVETALALCKKLEAKLLLQWDAYSLYTV